MTQLKREGVGHKRWRRLRHLVAGLQLRGGGVDAGLLGFVVGRGWGGTWEVPGWMGWCMRGVQTC